MAKFSSASFFSLVLLLASPRLSLAIDTTVGQIVDIRSNGKVMGRLEVELSVVGNDAEDVKGLRATIISVIDDTGKDIGDVSNHDKASQQFSYLKQADDGLKLKFKNPSRKAVAIKNLIGRVDVYIPKSDPYSTFVIDDVMSKLGKSIDTQTLKNNSIELSLTPDNEIQGASSEDVAEFISVKVSDPESKLVELEFQTEAGERIPSKMLSSSNNRTYYFPKALPQKTRLKVYVATPRSVVRLPFSFENVLLP